MDPPVPDPDTAFQIIFPGEASPFQHVIMICFALNLQSDPVFWNCILTGTSSV
jgi:hypothetical protein